MFAVKEAYHAGLLSKTHWLQNLIAGLVVGIIALPLAMAFAIASGAKPEQGIYTAIIAGLTVSILGGSRVQIAGPTGAFIVILAGITAEHGIIGLQISTFIAGIFLLVMGGLRLGKIIQYIPTSVILGFTAGIGVVIFVGQWPAFLGIDYPQASHFHQKLFTLFKNIPALDSKTTFLGLSALIILILTPKIPIIKKIPASLYVLVIFTSLQTYFQFESVATIGSSFGGIQQGLPQFNWLGFELDQWTSLVGPAITIAFLGAIESLLSATVADKMANTRHRPNQELIAQGFANMLTPLFGGFAATGAIARTAANIKNGGNSPLSGIIHSLVLIAIIVMIAPLAQNIPLSVLAAILFIVAWNMSDLSEVIKALKIESTNYRIILLWTFIFTLFTDLIFAVFSGVLLSLLLNFLAHLLQKKTSNA